MTGVQTCALPISVAQTSARSAYPGAVVPAKDTESPTLSGLGIIPFSTIPSDLVTLTSTCRIKLSPLPPRTVVIIFGSGAKPLLCTWTSRLHISGRVCVGPGVEETEVDVGVGVAGVVVTTGVGVGVTGGVAGCVHPAASTSTMQSKPADAITNDLFIPDSYPGGYLRVVFSGVNANPGIILLSKTVF